VLLIQNGWDAATSIVKRLWLTKILAIRNAKKGSHNVSLNTKYLGNGGSHLAPLPTINCVLEPPKWLSYSYILTKDELSD
jgi:hypothetical protein